MKPRDCPLCRGVFALELCDTEWSTAMSISDTCLGESFHIVELYEVDNWNNGSLLRELVDQAARDLAKKAEVVEKWRMENETKMANDE